MPAYLIALGSNKPLLHDDAATTLDAAITCIISGYSLSVKSIGRPFQTPAFPKGSGPDFVNSTLVLQSDLSPIEVLERLQAVELQFGRERKVRWAPRSLDLDILLADQIILPDAAKVKEWMGRLPENGTVAAPEELMIPHPRMHERAFVLGPAQDVAPGWIHPILGLSMTEMWQSLPEELRSEVKALP